LKKAAEKQTKLAVEPPRPQSQSQTKDPHIGQLLEIVAFGSTPDLPEISMEQAASLLGITLEEK